MQGRGAAVAMAAVAEPSVLAFSITRCPRRVGVTVGVVRAPIGGQDGCCSLFRLASMRHLALPIMPMRRRRFSSALGSGISIWA